MHGSWQVFMSIRFLALFLFLLPACVETHRVRRLGGELKLEPVEILARWKVFEGEKEAGRLLKVRLPGAADKEPFYLVQWPGGGPVGRIDGKGRAFRYEPFKKGLVLVGMDSLEEDVKTLLELGSLPTLRREKLGRAFPASFPKPGNSLPGTKQKKE